MQANCYSCEIKLDHKSNIIGPVPPSWRLRIPHFLKIWIQNEPVQRICFGNLFSGTLYEVPNLLSVAQVGQILRESGPFRP